MHIITSNCHYYAREKSKHQKNRPDKMDGFSYVTEST